MSRDRVRQGGPGEQPAKDETRVPRAWRWEVWMCEDPDCGPHLVFFDRNDVPICDAPMTAEAFDRLALEYGTQRRHS